MNETKKKLVIPDIHTNWKSADSIIKSNINEFDEIILLGDYFDNFNDTCKLNIDTAKWLKDLIYNEKVIALLGNHEFNYYKNKIVMQCSGFRPDKLEAINKILSLGDWSKLKAYHYDEELNILYTHAGATKNRFEHPVTGEFLFSALKKYDDTFTLLWHSEIGETRGGIMPHGGIFWCDFSEEFHHMKSINQVFGHTPLNEPVKIQDPYFESFSICLDTYPALQYYAEIDSHGTKIKKA